MDEIDRAIVAALQKDGRLSNQDLAALVGLTSAPCLRRLRKLEERGIIKGYRAIVDQAALDCGFEVIVHADVGKNDGPAIAEFEQRVAAMPEVVELRRMYSLFEENQGNPAVLESRAPDLGKGLLSEKSGAKIGRAHV